MTDKPFPLYRPGHILRSEMGDLIREGKLIQVKPEGRATQAGGMGSFQCNTCGEDCCAGDGCANPDYLFTPTYWPKEDGEYLLVRIEE